MVVPDLLFDIVLFGALLLALLLDNVFPFSPQLHGAATLLAVGLATYVAAQEMSEALDRRKWWAQESLATALAIATLAFVYYFKRNDSDLALLGLSVALMMTALMVLISVIAALGTAWNESSARPIGGLLATVLGALVLGQLSGLLVIVLSSEVSTALKAVILVVGAVLWKLRAVVLPPARNGAVGAPPGNQQTVPASGDTRPGETPNTVLGYDLSTGSPAHPGARWALMPQRGRLLDRFLPVLILGALFFLALQQSGSSLWSPASPAVAANGNPTNSMGTASSGTASSGTASTDTESTDTEPAPPQSDR
ncbi:MAG TPA: hypothetical protein VF600_06165 [Abditibacteriaceae bacterium]